MLRHGAIRPTVAQLDKQTKVSRSYLSRIEDWDRSQSRCVDKLRHRNTISLLCMEALTKEQEENESIKVWRNLGRFCGEHS